MSAPARKLAQAEASPWKPFEDRRRDRDTKREAVLRTAAQLFLDLGYDRTSLAEVALRLNITKPALYNYFRSKEEILMECYRLGQEMSEAGLAEVARMGGSGLDRLRALIRAYARIMAQEFGRCLVRIDDRVLSPDARRHVRDGKRTIDLGFRRIIEEGIADGSITPCDVKMAAFTVTGALNWMGHWYAPGERTPEEIGEQLALRLTDGLALQRATVAKRAKAERAKAGKKVEAGKPRAKRRAARGGA